MEPTKSEKPHVVLIPYPAQGHVNPLMQLAELLHSRGVHITFVYTESHKNRLTHSKGPEALQGLTDFRFETIPDGLPKPDRPDAARPTAVVCDSIRKHSAGPFKELLVKLNSAVDVPRVTCVVCDAVMSFAMKPAQELGIVEVQFWTASACGFMGYYQFAELVRRGIVPFKDESYKSNGCLETPLDWTKSMKGFKLKDLPPYCHTTNPQDTMLNYMIDQTENCKTSSALIINTIQELEPEVLSELSQTFPPIYTIGPLRTLTRAVTQTTISSIDSTLWRNNTDCLTWLDAREPRSVVYVSFGSVVSVTDRTVEEFAWGLAGSGFSFLWVLRPNVVKGEAAKLPLGFSEAVRDRGLVVDWCPQEHVLLHKSVGLFVTHAGWNSISESMFSGVPLLCYPIHAEQPTNSRSVLLLWGNGMAVGEDVDRDELARLVTEMMIGEEGERKRERALEWKRKAEEAIAVGGSSYANLEKLINGVILQKK